MVVGEVITQLRNICIDTRRQYSYYRRRVQKVQEEEDRLYQVYIDARMYLQEEIGSVKVIKQSSDQMIAGIDQDAYGTPYQMVLVMLQHVVWHYPVWPALQRERRRRTVSHHLCGRRSSKRLYADPLDGIPECEDFSLLVWLKP